MKRFFRDERGNVGVLFGLSLLPLVGAVGAAVDYARAADTKAKLQIALDAAVLAAAKASTGSAPTIGRDAFAANFSTTDAVTGPTITPNADGSVTGSASVAMSTRIIGALGRTAVTVAASATAAAGSTAGAGSAAGVCILLLETYQQGLTVNSGGDVKAPNCEIHVKSTANPAAMFNSGTTWTFARNCIQGSNVTQNSVTISNLSKGCSTVSDPYAGTLPAPPSTSSANCNGANYNGGSITLNPGVFCGWYNFNSTTNVAFKAGVYVIKSGGWNVNGGTWTCSDCVNGAGVTFYYADTSKIQFNSGVKATLSAPTTGTYAGLLFYEAGGLSKSDWVLNDSQGLTLTGLLYLPSRNVTLNSSSQISAGTMTAVFNKLIVDGTKWTIEQGPKVIPVPGSTGTAMRTVFLKS